MKKKTISVVAPFYNEEKNITFFFERIVPILNDIANINYEIICVNDGSKDHTQALLEEMQSLFANIVIVELSRNFGKEAALSAGIDHAAGDAVIPIDTDLQDPPELIKEMVSKWHQGYEVVLCKRSDRSTDTFFKRFTSSWFYKVHNFFSDCPLPENVGDFRLMDKVVVEAIKQLDERQRFMKGLFSWAGFQECYIEYKREERAAGDTKWNYWKLWNFALEGITAHSTVPLRIWTYLGAFISVFAGIYGAFIVLRTLFFGVDVPGYASLLVIVLFLSGFQILSIGVMGEYVGRIHLESKKRPTYIVRNTLSSDDKTVKKLMHT